MSIKKKSRLYCIISRTYTFCHSLFFCNKRSVIEATASNTGFTYILRILRTRYIQHMQVILKMVIILMLKLLFHLICV